MIHTKTVHMSFKKISTLLVILFACHGHALASWATKIGENSSLKWAKLVDVDKLPHVVLDQKTYKCSIQGIDETLAAFAGATWAGMKSVGCVLNSLSLWKRQVALRRQILPEMSYAPVEPSAPSKSFWRRYFSLRKTVALPEAPVNELVGAKTVTVEDYNKMIQKHNDFVAKLMKRSSRFKRMLARRIPVLSALGVYVALVSDETEKFQTFAKDIVKAS